jgi:hypothetical protein
MKEGYVMIPVTAGDCSFLYGSLGMGSDYTVRFTIRLTDLVDEDMLKNAVSKTQQRYPYLSVRLRYTDTEFYYEENPLPVTVHHSDGSVTLNAEETNYHVWAVSFNEDRVHFDIFHAIADGQGMYMMISTMLYYYCHERYGVTDHTGIRTLEDPVLPAESADPCDALPQLPPEYLKNRQTPPLAFCIKRDGGVTPGRKLMTDIAIPEKEFIRFTSQNDASPGTMVSILLTRAIDRLFPERDKLLTNAYVINCRPMLGEEAKLSHHNCVHAVMFNYTDRIKAMPFAKQCTVHRGTTFVQSDADRIKKVMTFTASRNRMILKGAATLEEKKQAFVPVYSSNHLFLTSMVSYVGQWKIKQLSPYIAEFWTHVPSGVAPTTEIAAVNGKIFFSVTQSFEEDCLIKAFLSELEENGISYQAKPTAPNDVARFAQPQ